MKSGIRQLLFVLVMTVLPVAVQAQTSFQLQPESRVWIDGSSNVNKFTCEAEAVRGNGRAQVPGGVRQASTAPVRSTAQLNIPVRSFDCGQKRMNADMQKALKASAHPEVRYTLVSAEVISVPATASGWYKIKTTGTLTIAGVEAPVEVIAEGRQIADGLFRIKAQKPMRMSTFGVTPPTALLGMVKANDNITVRFDLVAASQDYLVGTTRGNSVAAGSN